MREAIHVTSSQLQDEEAFCDCCDTRHSFRRLKLIVKGEENSFPNRGDQLFTKIQIFHSGPISYVSNIRSHISYLQSIPWSFIFRVITNKSIKTFPAEIVTSLQRSRHADS